MDQNKILTGSLLKKTSDVRVRMNQRFFHDFHPIPLDDMKRGPLLNTALPLADAAPPRCCCCCCCCRSAAPATGAVAAAIPPTPPPPQIVVLRINSYQSPLALDPTPSSRRRHRSGVRWKGRERCGWGLASRRVGSRPVVRICALGFWRRMQSWRWWWWWAWARGGGRGRVSPPTRRPAKATARLLPRPQAAAHTHCIFFLLLLSLLL